MGKHTPGPWQILPEECDRAYIRVRGTLPGARYKIANVTTPTYEDVHEREARETRANARLIAAAPELLEVARMIAFGIYTDDAIREAALAAHTKATGESHG